MGDEEVTCAAEEERQEEGQSLRYWTLVSGSQEVKVC